MVVVRAIAYSSVIGNFFCQIRISHLDREWRYVLRNMLTAVGLFHGQLVRKITCIVRHIQVPADGFDEKIELIVIVIPAVSGFIVLSLMLLTISGRRRKALRESSPLFSIILCLGALCGLSSVTLHLLDPSQDVCELQSWLFQIGAIAVVGSLLIKQRRLSQLTSGVRPNSFTLFLIFVNALLLGIFIKLPQSIMYPLKPSSLLSLGDVRFHNICKSDSPVLEWISLLYLGLMALLIFLLAIINTRIIRGCGHGTEVSISTAFLLVLLAAVAALDSMQSLDDHVFFVSKVSLTCGAFLITTCVCVLSYIYADVAGTSPEEEPVNVELPTEQSFKFTSTLDAASPIYGRAPGIELAPMPEVTHYDYEQERFFADEAKYSSPEQQPLETMAVQVEDIPTPEPGANTTTPSQKKKKRVSKKRSTPKSGPGKRRQTPRKGSARRTQTTPRNGHRSSGRKEMNVQTPSRRRFLESEYESESDSDGSVASSMLSFASLDHQVAGSAGRPRDSRSAATSSRRFPSAPRMEFPTPPRPSDHNDVSYRVGNAYGNTSATITPNLPSASGMHIHFV